MRRGVAGQLPIQGPELSTGAGELTVGRAERLPAALEPSTGLLEALPGGGQGVVVGAVDLRRRRRVLGGPAHRARHAVHEPRGQCPGPAAAPRLLGLRLLLLAAVRLGLRVRVLLGGGGALLSRPLHRGRRRLTRLAERRQLRGLFAPLPGGVEAGAGRGGGGHPPRRRLPRRSGLRLGGLSRAELGGGGRRGGVCPDAPLVGLPPGGDDRRHLREPPDLLRRGGAVRLPRLLFGQHFGGTGFALGRLRETLTSLAHRLRRGARTLSGPMPRGRERLDALRPPGLLGHRPERVDARLLGRERLDPGPGLDDRARGLVSLSAPRRAPRPQPRPRR